MQLQHLEIRLNVRSGLVSGLLEAIAILIFAPVITRGTTNIYNALTTRRVFKGTLVKILDNSLSVEDIIPRIIRIIRTAFTTKPQSSAPTERTFADVTRQLVPLLISFVMSVAIVLTSSFIDGATVPVYRTRHMFLWNGGMFVDTTSKGVNSRAGDILGMAGVRRACVERVGLNTFNLFAVAFFEEQRFKAGRAANSSLCVNGRDTRETIGVTIQTDRIFNPASTEYLTVEEMEGAPASFTFLETLNRVGTPDYCRVRVSIKGSSTDWTFSSEESGTRFATQATTDGNGTLTLRAGVAFRNLDAPETWGGVESTPCTNLSSELFAPNRFTAIITTIGVEQDPQQLELVVADLLRSIAYSGYNRVESQEVMLRSYYAGAEVSSEHPDQSFGAFVPRQIETAVGSQNITTISGFAVGGLILTVIGCLILFLVMIFVRPTVRVTSVSYISRLYSRREWESQTSAGMIGEVEYIGMKKNCDGSLYASPVQMTVRES